MTAHPARLLLLAPPALLLAACTAKFDHPADTPRPAPAREIAPPQPAPPAEPVVPDDRRCGQAGEAPTELPPALAAGRNPAGSGVVRPDETLTIGTVQLKYRRSTWHGTHRAGYHGPGLHIEIDRAEVGEHAPWGTLVELHPGRESHVDVGPYRIDLRVAAATDPQPPGQPPAEVTVTVTREVCPPAVVIEPAAASRSLWVSTEGIRLHTYDLQGQLLQLSLDAQGDVPRLDVSNLGYRHWLEPRPGGPRSLRVARHTVTLDRVVPGPGTRFADRWQADPHARLHVRARIDPAPPLVLPEPVPPDGPCGAPSAARTHLPAALGATPRVTQARTLDVGQRARLGALDLDYRTLEIPAYGHGPYREEARQVPNLQILAGPLGGAGMPGPFREPRFARHGFDLLRIDAEPGGPEGRVRLRRVAVTCPKELTVPAPDPPTYVWLSTLGHGLVTVGHARSIPLTLQLTVDDGEPALLLGSEHAHVSRAVHPDLVGLGFTLDDHLVEVVDLATGADTTFDGRRYHSPGLAPIVHLQLRIGPQPPA